MLSVIHKAASVNGNGRSTKLWTVYFKLPTNRIHLKRLPKFLESKRRNFNYQATDFPQNSCCLRTGYPLFGSGFLNVIYFSLLDRVRFFSLLPLVPICLTKFLLMLLRLLSQQFSSCSSTNGKRYSKVIVLKKQTLANRSHVLRITQKN